MARNLDEIFGNKPSGIRTLDQIFAPPAPVQKPEFSIPLNQLTSSHSPKITPSYKTAFIKGTLSSLAGRALTPLVEKATGRDVDLSTLPEPETLGQKALSFGSGMVTDLPAWLAGDLALARPLAALAKTAPIAKVASLAPKITPALGTGVRAASTYSLPINAAETALSGDGVEGFAGRLKEAPLMALGGVALHGGGQLIGKGIKGASNNLLERKLNYPDMVSDPLADVQNAFKSPTTLRDVKAQELNKTFSDTTNNLGKTDQTLPKQGATIAELLQQKQADAVSAFGGPLKSYKINNDIAEIEARMDKQVQDIAASLKQADGQTRIETIRNQVREMGGISPGNANIFEEQKVIPNWIRNRNGRPLDEVADTLGINSDELLRAIDSSAYKPKDYGLEAYKAARNNKEYQNLSNTLDTLKASMLTTQKVNGPISLKPRGVKAQPIQEIPTPRPEKPSPSQWTNKDNIPKVEPPYQSLRNGDRLQPEFIQNAPIGKATEIPKVGNLKITPPLPKEQKVFWQSVSKELYSKGERPPFTLELMKKDIQSGKLDISKLSNEAEIRQMLGMDLQKFGSTVTPGITPEITQGSNVAATMGEGPGNAETFRAKIDREPVKRKSFKEILKGARTQFVDDLAPLEELEKNVSGKVASAEDSLYKQGRLFRGSPERAGELIKSSLEPVIKQVEKSGKTTKDLGDYALAVHAKDVNAKGINSGFTDEEIAATIQEYGTPEMEAARKELMKISNDSLDSLAEAGIIEESLVTALREKHPNYMPLFRSFDDDKIEFASGVSKALANVTSPIERLKGSGRNVIDPIESMVKNVYRTVSAVDRNKVALQLGGLADKDANAAFIRRLPEGEERARLNSVYAMEEGKRVHYEVQPDVYKALMNLDKESSNILIRMLQKPASLLRAGATLTPEFSLRNPMRDIPAAFAVSKSGLNPVTDIPKALFDVIRSKRGKETLYNQFLKDNAGYGNIISMDRKVHQEVMNDILSQPASKKFVNIVSGKSLVGVLRSIADVSESATKLGEYKAALRSGASRPEAAYRARDIMDFSRAGASIRETNKIVAFLNANIQGKSKLYRSIKEDPVGVTARAFTSVTLPTVGAFMAQKYLANDRQKTIIEGAEDWLTSSFWLVPVPGTDQVARIPKPFDLAPMFANLPERTLKYIFDNDPEAFGGFAKQTLASTSIPTMITGLIPFIEGMANYSFFRQSPIIPQRESDLNYPDQYDVRTTETAKFLAKGVNKLTDGQGPLRNFGSPRIMDNTIKGTTAGLGTYATSAIDFVAETSGLVDKKQKPARNISELPLLRAFLASEKSDKSLGKVYDEKDKLTRNKGSAKIDSPKAKFPEEKRLKQLNETTGKIGDITKEIRKIENDRNLAPLLKRERINSLTEKRNLLARKSNG